MGFVERIFIPILILFILVLFFHEKNFVNYCELGLFLAILISSFPAKLEALHNRDIENAFRQRIEPLVENSGVLKSLDNTTLFVSSDI